MDFPNTSLQEPPRVGARRRADFEGIRVMRLFDLLRAGDFLRAGLVPAAFACLVVIVPHAAPAQEDVQVAGAFELPPVVSSASRLAAGLSSSSVTVVDSDAIARHPGKTLPEILETEAGLHTRDFFGNGTSSFSTVDIRGFGEQATQNTLVLVDGRRINDLDLSGVQFTLVPRNAIARIEVLRGAAAAVLYGEGAVGGAINIVTRGGVPEAGVQASVGAGSFGYRRAQGMFAFGGTPAHVALSADVTQSDGYRRNNKLMRHVYAANVTIDTGCTSWRAGASYNTERVGLPGGRLVDSSIGLDRVNNDPKGTANPNDVAEERGVRFEAGGQTQLADGITLIVDTAYRRSVTSSDFFSQFTRDDRALGTATFTPRITYSGAAGGHAVNLIAGVDVTHTTADVERRFIGFAGGADFDGRQTSVAVYAQGDVGLTEALVLDAGVRLVRTTARLESPQNAAARSNESDFDISANLGLAYDVSEAVTVFARGGRAVRVPTIDERVGTRVDPLTFLPVTFALDTQTSWDAEVGTTVAIGPVDARLSVFQMTVNDQIAFTPDTIAVFGFNTNLDKTRRRGIEFEAAADLGAGFRIKPQVNWTEAVFTKGQFDGNDVPAVPNLTGGVGLDWTADAVWVGVNWRYVSEQRMLNDQGATFPKIPSYSLVDVSAGGTLGPVTLKGELRNAFDQEYYAVAVASDTNPTRYSAFPLPGRAFYVEASVAF